MWFSSWADIARVVVLTIVGWGWLTTLIRLFGKRTISKMNPGDFVVTVALGSMVSTLVLFSKQIPVANGIAALAAMVVVQFCVEWTTARSRRLRQAIDGSPVLLVHNGRMLHDNMRRENIDDQDILEALRRHDVASVADTQAVILEIDGSFSVIKRENTDRRSSTLHDVKHSS
jgi:uncharacterized membrane protein YcaP (DUF421 family)